jgi:N-glycosylase/DNA lyase
MKMSFSLMFLFFFSVNVFAQNMDKEEAKMWKERLNSMSMDEFKALVNMKAAAQVKSNEDMKRLQEIRNQILSKDDEIIVLKNKIKQLQKETAEIDASDKSDKGIVFKIQIGAFEKVDITSQANNQKTDLTAEKDNNVKKYSVGYFRDYWQADKFKKCLQTQGIEDAWIVAYKDGKRVDIKDVLKEVL